MSAFLGVYPAAVGGVRGEEVGEMHDRVGGGGKVQGRVRGGGEV